MALGQRAAAVIRWILRRDREEQALSDELDAFVEMATADRLRAGVPPAEARRQALLQLGGVEQAKERVRTGRHGAALDEIARDARYALRTFRRQPGFTAVIVVTVALGIGANTAIFSLIDALMLRWLPVPQPQELLQVRLHAPGDPAPGGESFSYAIVKALAGRKEIFAAVGGFSGFTFDVGISGSTVRVPGALVTGGYYETLRLTPAAGRLLTPRDDEGGAPIVAVASDGYWEREWARRPDAVGATVRVNGVAVTIVGVSPPGFVGANVGAVADLTLAVAALPRLAPAAAPLLGPGNFWLRVLARPVPGLSSQAAAVRLDAAWPTFAETVIAPHWEPSRRRAMAASVFTLEPGGTGWTWMRGLYRKPLYVLMAGVGLVLLIACANVASLLLARAAARRREMALRLAIGAGRAQLVRQLVIESLLLAGIAAGAGVALAWGSGRVLVSLMATGPAPLALDVAPNGHVLAFAAAIAAATGLLFGVAPALLATGAAPVSALRDDSRTGSVSLRLLPWLVSGQVALALILLAGAGLFVRTLHNLRSLDPGFDPAPVLVVELPGARIPPPGALLAAVDAVPGVRSASLTTHTPLNGSTWSEPAVPGGQALPERDTALFIGVGPDFFSTLQAPLRAGRVFTERDAATSPAVAIVNDSYVRRWLGDAAAPGRRLSARVRGVAKTLEIVGVVADMRVVDLREDPRPIVYVPYAQAGENAPTAVVVRAAGAPGPLAVAIRQAIRERLPEMSADVHPLAAQVDATLVQERMMAMLASAFGGLALLLACVGLYGLLAYSVVQRTREIGIRMALGAGRGRVVRGVLGGGARLVLIGILIGLPVVWGVSRLVASMLFGLTPTDPTVLAGAVAVLVAAAQLATCVPALRAAGVEPLVALRHD